MTIHLPLAFFNNLFEGPDLLVILMLGLLLFGRRLPEMGKNLGRSITNFKEGLKGGGDDGDADGGKSGGDVPQIKPRQKDKDMHKLESGNRAAVPPALPVSEEP